MKLKTLLSLSFLIPASAIAGGKLTKASPSSDASDSSCSYYAGLGAGVNFLDGKRPAQAFAVPAGNLIGNVPGSSSISESFDPHLEIFGGLEWSPSNSSFALALEPSFSHTNINDQSQGIVTVNVNNIPVNNLVVTNLQARYGFGIDAKPSLKVNDNNRVYGLLGAEWRNFQYKYADGDGSFKTDKNLLGFTWGLGWEYLMDRNVIGLRFKHRIYKKKTFVGRVPATEVRAKVDPDLYTVMLTYAYKFGS